jgi:autotransporter-associated beta strand protein
MKMVGEEGGVIMSNADFRMNAPLSGTVLTKKGSGCLFTMANNTLSRIVISSGSVAAQSGNPATTVEFESGTLWDDSQATTHAIHVPKGKVGTWQLTYTYYTAYSNKLTGSGTLTIVPRNTVSRVRITGDWSQFEGTVKHTNKDIWLPLDMSGGMPRGTLDLAEGCTATNVCQEYTIGRLTGKGSLAHPVANFYGQGAVSGNNTWNIGNDDLGDFTFAGTFTDGGGGNKCIFNKIGSCTMTVSGKSNHTGATTVKEGTLKVSMGGLLGKGSLTVASGATLMGTNTSSTQLTNSSTTIQSGGRLLIGATETTVTGNLFFGGKNLTVNEGAVVEFGINRKANLTNTGGTCIQNVNRLTINGTIRIHYPDAGTSLVVGDSVLLWKDVTTVAGTPKLESEIISIADGLFWDTTDLARGILRVTSQVPTSLRSTFAATTEEAVYDARGNRLATLRRGLNIIRRSDGTSRKVFVK